MITNPRELSTLVWHQSIRICAGSNFTYLGFLICAYKPVYIVKFYLLFNRCFIDTFPSYIEPENSYTLYVCRVIVDTITSFVERLNRTYSIRIKSLRKQKMFQKENELLLKILKILRKKRNYIIRFVVFRMDFLLLNSILFSCLQEK